MVEMHIHLKNLDMHARIQTKNPMQGAFLDTELPSLYYRTKGFYMHPTQVQGHSMTLRSHTSTYLKPKMHSQERVISRHCYFIV